MAKEVICKNPHCAKPVPIYGASGRLRHAICSEYFSNQGVERPAPYTHIFDKATGEYHPATYIPTQRDIRREAEERKRARGIAAREAEFARRFQNVAKMFSKVKKF